MQTKLKVGPPDDIYEQEADRMAEVVIGMSQQRNNSQPHEHGSQVGDDKLILRKPGGQGSEKRANNRLQYLNLSESGQPLSSTMRSFFEPRFGYDFGHVRLHTGSQAAELSHNLKAKAFTLGQDIVFTPNEFAPGTQRGNRLLAHELVHTIQQKGDSQPVIRRQARLPDDVSQPPNIPQPPNAITIDLLDPLNSSLRIGGWGLPSPRDIMNGLNALRRFGRPGTPTTPIPLPIWPQPQLTDEELRRIMCQTLPHLCQTQPTTPTFPPLPTIPPLTLPRLRIPRLVFVERQIYDHFVFDNDAIPDRHRLAIDRTATRMIDQPALVSDIFGHTDTRGPTQHNQRLSERRAETIKNHMLNRQVPPLQIWNVVGRGESQPRFPNDAVDDLAASRNRRVELELQRLTFILTFFPDLQLRLPPPTTLGIRDPRTRVLPGQRVMYNTLRNFIVQVRAGINGLLAAPPAGEPWASRDNENITQMLERLDRLIADLRSDRHVVRFDLPRGNATGASYSVLEDMIHLRPFTSNEQRNQVAASLLHEYAHFFQDITAEQLQRAARTPIEHTREDELRQETESRRHEVYFIRLMNLVGHSVGFHQELNARVFLRRFERVRTGSPTDQAAARREIRQELETVYAAQLAANAPSRRYLIEIRGNRHAILIRTGGAETDLGAVPAGVTTRSQLNTHLFDQIHLNPIRPSLFQGSGGTRYAVIIFLVFDAGRKVGEFGDRP